MAKGDKNNLTPKALGAGDEGETMPGSTGFYYITPGSEWDDSTLSRKRSYFRLITLPSYIWRELVKGVLLSAAVFSVVLMAVFAAQVMRDGVGAYTMMLVLPNFLPLICPFVLPLAIITGILICYSRLSKDNEILAAYAGGINPFWLMLPALLTSVIAIFITLTLNEVAMLPAISNIEKLVIDDQANILTRMMTRPGNMTLAAGEEYLAMSKLDPERDPSGRASLDITRFALPGADNNGNWDTRYPFPAKRVVARDHQIQDMSGNAAEEMVLKMTITKPVFQDLHATDINKTFIADGESGEERIVLNSRPNVTIHRNRSSFWPILELSRTRRVAEESLREMHSGPTRIEDLPEAQRLQALNQQSWLERTVRTRTAEINTRLSLCFSCFAFAIIGIPLGMRTRGTIASSFAVGIVMATGYFVLLKAAEIQASRGFLPPWTIWVPDVLLVIIGVIMWKRSSAAK